MWLPSWFLLLLFYGPFLAVNAARAPGDSCLLEVQSSSSMSGSIESSLLESLASSSAASSSATQPFRCILYFIGEANQKVSVRFTYFKLFSPHSLLNTSLPATKCMGGDSVAIDVRLDGRLSRVDEWCEEDSPPQVMAPTNHMQIHYTLKSGRWLSRRGSNEYGFRLSYVFHSDWRMEGMKAKWDKNKHCRFAFNASLARSGELWSVNHPGLYPRATLCEYVFYGDEQDVVHIHFDYFDIEGFNQCDESTQSDFVLFSNYQTHDRTNRRFCGKMIPRNPVISESNYFRMIFSTNEVFDGTGFHARFQFVTPRKSSLSRVKGVPSGGSRLLPLAVLPLLILM